MDAKQKSILVRIKQLEAAIIKGRQYLENGANADWVGFRPLFNRKVKNGTTMPPHPMWVKNFYLPRQERALFQAEKLLARLQARK